MAAPINQTNDITVLLAELKNTQEQILQRLDNVSLEQQRILQRLDVLEEKGIVNGEKQDQRLDVLEMNSATTSHEVGLLATQSNDIQEDLTKKFQTLSHALYTPASKRVAEIPELVELILFQLPMKDLLLAERVSRNFKAIIDGSSALQIALFFKPLPTHSKDGSLNKPTINPLLGQNPNEDPDPNSYHGRSPYRLSAKVEGIYDDEEARADPAARLAVDISLRTHRDPLHIYAECRRESTGSWRRMYLTQPPCAIDWYSGLAWYSGSSPIGTCGDMMRVWTKMPAME